VCVSQITSRVKIRKNLLDSSYRIGMIRLPNLPIKTSIFIAGGITGTLNVTKPIGVDEMCTHSHVDEKR